MGGMAASLRIHGVRPDPLKGELGITHCRTTGVFPLIYWDIAQCFSSADLTMIGAIVRAPGIPPCRANDDRGHLRSVTGFKVEKMALKAQARQQRMAKHFKPGKAAVPLQPSDPVHCFPSESKDRNC